ncbi:hypothetical protein JFL43_08905 [Viridibacillus sp. YIM B01967]|uniref:Uncharacterized protein n=1 Tax=Viridibacillus soli TaxID=2798301 RepID=A0ABS1H6D3_9BACL|nr:hypothetical protein [Viridibacillus soli]MBK3494978.1 hypothetical protein [Viridibacillus soli]
MHQLAFSILINGLCFLEGAYASALYHARRAVDLSNRKDVNAFLELLFLYSVPEKIVSDKEAVRICSEILELDLQNNTAKAILKELT